MLSEEHKIPVKAMVRETMRTRKHVLLALIAIAGVWLVATAVFVTLNLIGVGGMTFLVLGGVLYTVGTLLYQMLCGRAPFTDDDAVVVMAKHIREMPEHRRADAAHAEL